MSMEYSRAYALWRAAESALAAGSRSKAQDSLRRAFESARAMGAGPLLAEITGLAQRGRIRLTEDAAPETERTSKLPLGITRREADVLQLVARGRTNRER